MFCCNLAKTVPTNYILCTLFTLGESYSVSITTSYYEPSVVLMAGFMTVIVTLGITIYACTTKNDFTYPCGACYIFAFALLSTVVCWLVLPKISYLHRLWALLGVVIYGFYLLYDI